jgi:3-keto-5-aminohexanoate cleavage enzyme
VARPPVVIEARVNEYTGRAVNPYVPWTPADLVADAEACRDAGAAILHWHAREPGTGAPTASADAYAATAKGVRAATDLILMPTLGAGTLEHAAERTAHVVAMAADPATAVELAPLDMGTFNLDPWDAATATFRTEDLVYRSTVGMLREVAATLDGVGVRPMAALWTVGSARLLGAFLDAGVMREPVYTQILLSQSLLSTHPRTVAGLLALEQFLPAGRAVPWSFLVVGGSVLPVLGAALERGGHVAVGLGDHPYLELGDGRPPRNDEVVAHVAAAVRSLGHEVATPDQARELLALR